MARDITPAEARRLIWESGNISEFLLDANQKEIYEHYTKSPRKTLIAVFSRQMGKTFSLVTIAVEKCLKSPNATVIYISPRLNQGKKIIRATLLEILKTCPQDMQPEYKTQESCYLFPNGARLELGGFNAGEIESQRGGKAVLVIVDECGFMDELKYGLRSVLYPKLNTTKGKMLLCSTLPKSAEHEYWELVKKAEFDGTLIKKDIFSCPRYTRTDVDGFAEEVGGYDSVDFKREYLNIMITDQESAVVPEATEEKMKLIIGEQPRPAFFDCYVAMDIGFKDFTAIIFGYYDFLQNKVVIEDEYVVKGNKVTTRSLHAGISEKESELWLAKPYLRYADNNNLILLNELSQEPYNLVFIPTAKDNKEAAISKLRLLVQNESILISPKCKYLIDHLKYATWNTKRTGFDRDTQHGHFDTLDALIYFVRNVQYNKNPYPSGHFLPSGTLWETNQVSKLPEFHQELKNLFNPFKKRK
jgi:hypothetical protein